MDGYGARRQSFSGAPHTDAPPPPAPPTLATLPPTPLLGLGCPTLDGLLRGGLPVGKLTEVVGEATAGKTQLCLRLLLRVQAPVSEGGLGGRALWIYTEGDPPLRRLAALAPVTPGLPPGADPGASVLVDRHVATPGDLMAALDRADSLCAAAAGGPAPIRLIIVDSVAAIFRDCAAAAEAPGTPAAASAPPSSSGRAQYAARAEAMFAAAAALKRLASHHGLVALAVNQVTDVVGSEGGGGAPPALPPPPRAPAHTAGLRLRSSGREVAPALGLAWAHCVDVRLFLSRMYAGGAGGWGDGGGGGAGGAHHATLRCLQVVFAPHLPPCYAYARVGAEGLVGAPPEDMTATVAALGTGRAAAGMAAPQPLGERGGNTAATATAATGGASAAAAAHKQQQGQQQQQQQQQAWGRV